MSKREIAPSNMTIGLLLEAIWVGLIAIGLGFLTFGFLFDKEWPLYAAASIMIVVFIYAIVLSFIYQNLKPVWNAPI